MPRKARQLGKNPALKRLGARIRDLRDGKVPELRIKVISQEELAHRAHIARSYMSRIERGVQNCSVLHIIRIARALDVRVGDLFPEKPRSSTST